MSEDLRIEFVDRAQGFTVTAVEKETVSLPSEFFSDVNFKMVPGENRAVGSFGHPLKWGAKLVRFLEANGITEASVVPGNLEPEHLVTGALLSAYRFTKYTGAQREPVTLRLVSERSEVLAHALKVAEAVNFTRDLVSEPANALPPDQFVKAVKDKMSKLDVNIKVFDENELKDAGFGGVIAVAKGSINPPRLLIAEYTRDSGAPLALVGKGVIFDSGGLNLKVQGGIERMFTDKAGAAAVVGALYAAALLGARRHLLAVAPLVENMPSGSATRPGDIIRIHNGKTVEVANTDAEGRLILADALSYTENEFSPKEMIDVATLTGAKMVALGPLFGAVMGNTHELNATLIMEGESVLERLWELPLPDEYSAMLKSSRANLRNVASEDRRDAGCIIGGLFLKNFVRSTPWAHLDIAGCAYSEADTSLFGKGATGFGVRLLLKHIESGSATS